MLASSLLSRASRSVGGRLLLLVPALEKHQLPVLSNQFHALVHGSPNKLAQVSLFHHTTLNSSIFQRFGFSSASPEPNEKEHGSTVGNNGAESTKPTGDDKASIEVEDAGAEGTKATEQRKESDLESEIELSRDELVNLVKEKEELLKAKHEEIKQLQDKFVRSLAEMENVKDRTRREAENSKKFAIQNFAKSLLDVADNLGRASSVVKESFSKIDTSNDTTGAVPLLKSLLEGVEMTEKQLLEVFKKFGIENFDPMNQPFDPHMHNAAFQVPDNSKPPGTVAHVLKLGYTLNERVIRPAEVGVIIAVENDAAEKDQA